MYKYLFFQFELNVRIFCLHNFIFIKYIKAGIYIFNVLSYTTNFKLVHLTFKNKIIAPNEEDHSWITDISMKNFSFLKKVKLQFLSYQTLLV